MFYANSLVRVAVELSNEYSTVLVLRSMWKLRPPLDNREVLESSAQDLLYHGTGTGGTGADHYYFLSSRVDLD